jgi:dTDP-4-dehydrorhamnose reductase
MAGLKILLVGAEGQVAFELRRTLACLGDLAVRGRGIAPALDLADFDSIRAAVRDFRPSLIVNAAAYTAVDKAEQEPDAAFRINGEGVGVLAEEARAAGAALIHYSTDYVFPGNAAAPYREDDPVGPLGAYGRSKLAGEEAIRAAGGSHLILRTAWVYGSRGGNFLLTMLRLMRERDLLRVVDDQHGAPTWSRLIAEATALLIARSATGSRVELDDRSGTYHLTSGGETTWYGFAEKIRELALARELLPETSARLEAIPTSGYPTPAKRPAYSVLSNDRLADAFGVALPDWEQALQLCLDEMRP